MREHIQYDFLQDGHFAELKKAELLENRLNSLQTIEPYIGTFFSKEYVLKNVLSMTDVEMMRCNDKSVKRQLYRRWWSFSTTGHRWYHKISSRWWWRCHPCDDVAKLRGKLLQRAVMKNQNQRRMEMATSRDFVDAVVSKNNLDAEDAF